MQSWAALVCLIGATYALRPATPPRQRTVHHAVEATLADDGRAVDVAFADGAWRLDGLEDKVGRYEPGRGAHEPLSQWCLRSLDRLAGRVTYTTPEPHVP